MFMLATSISGASWPLIFWIVGLVLLFFAAFITPSADANAPFFRRLHLGWAGLFFVFVAIAFGGR